jgi:hypothetical protein
MHLAPHLTPEHPMKTPRLALHLLAATLLAAAWPAHADPLHGGARLPDTTVRHASPLSSDWSLFVGALRPIGNVTSSRTRIDLRADAHGAPMLGLPGHELAQLRDGVGRVRSMPQASLGTTPRASLDPGPRL